MIVQAINQQHYSAPRVGVFKLGSSLLGAGAMTAGLLFIMVKLIATQELALEEPKAFTVPKFVHVPKTEEVAVKESTIALPKPPPERAQVDYKTDFVGQDAINVNPPVDLLFKEPIDITVGSAGQTKLVPVIAEYPPRAITRGLCGSVIVQYDVSAAGIPVNVAVLSSTNRIFERNAKKAVSGYRFNPMMDNGKAVMVTGKQEKVSFELEGGC